MSLAFNSFLLAANGITLNYSFFFLRNTYIYLYYCCSLLAIFLCFSRTRARIQISHSYVHFHSVSRTLLFFSSLIMPSSPPMSTLFGVNRFSKVIYFFRISIYREPSYNGESERKEETLEIRDRSTSEATKGDSKLFR